MKGTEHFKKTIQMYLEQRAAEDELFAERYRNPNKDMDGCVTYILNWVKNSGCNGFSDGEIYGQALHFWDEDEIEVGEPIDCHVVVNHAVPLSEEEKEEARRKAVERYQNEVYQRLKERNKPKAATNRETNTIEQPSLFDF